MFLPNKLYLRKTKDHHQGERPRHRATLTQKQANKNVSCDEWRLLMTSCTPAKTQFSDLESDHGTRPVLEEHFLLRLSYLCRLSWHRRNFSAGSLCIAGVVAIQQRLVRAEQKPCLIKLVRSPKKLLASKFASFPKKTRPGTLYPENHFELLGTTARAWKYGSQHERLDLTRWVLA